MKIFNIPALPFFIFIILAAIALMLSFQQPTLTGWQAQKSQALVAHYTFDGCNAFDSSGNDNHGIIHGASCVDSPIAKGGKALSFNGVNSWVEIGDSSSLKLNKTGTIEFWYKADIRIGYPTFGYPLIQKGTGIGWGNNVNGSFSVFSHSVNVTGFGDYMAFAITDGFNYNSVHIKPRPSVGRWHHVVFTFNGTHIHSYLDGKLNMTNVQKIPNANQADLPIWIGKFGTNHTNYFQYFKGLIDEVKIYNIALTTAEINASYQASKPALPDLTISGVYFDENKTAYVKVKNIGTASSSACILGVRKEFAQPFFLFNVPAIAANNETTITIGRCFENKTITVKVDALNIVEESDEGNNVWTGTPYPLLTFKLKLTLNDSCTPAGGKCILMAEACPPDKPITDITKTCLWPQQKCCMPAVAHKISLQSPKNNSVFFAPTTIMFNWTTTNFTNATPSCMVATLDMIANSEDFSDFILCNKNKTCSWTSAFNTPSSYAWAVGCWNNPYDVENFIFSDFWFFDVKAVNAILTLISPAQASILAPGNVTFVWKPENFVNATLPCLPYAWENGTDLSDPATVVYSPIDEYGNPTFIFCGNNASCNWTTEIDLPAVYLWQVVCANNETDFVNNCTDCTFSEEINFKIQTAIACIENWTAISDWIPVTCLPEENQTKTFREFNNCGTANAMPLGCILTKTTIPFECIQQRNCPVIVPAGLTQITPWQPYPCTETQSATFQYQNGTSIIQTRPCCIESWDLTWQDCINGTRIGTWKDKNQCGTTYTKPADIEESCGLWPKRSRIWPWLLIGAILAVIASLVKLRQIKVKKAAKKIEEIKPELEVKPKPKLEEKYIELEEFVKKARARGFSKNQIKQKLVEAGWSQDVVEKALESFK